jgi:thioredoxin reductase
LFAVCCVTGAEPRTATSRRVLSGRKLIIATGAYDRQLPFPGWDLPGVMAAGGVQALLKAHGVCAGDRVVVAGTGPFLLSVADTLLTGGARVVAVLEANSPAGFARHPSAVFGAADKLGEAAAYAARLARARVPYRAHHAVVEALGADQLDGVRVARLGRDGMPLAGSQFALDCDVLAVGWGFTPQLELALQLGCKVAVAADGALAVEVDATQATTVPAVWAAGEATGVGGVKLATSEGAIAGRAACGLAATAPMRAARATQRRFATSMHAVHPIPAFLLAQLPEHTVVCRCEEVSAGAIAEAVSEWGASDARSVKLLARPGMGWCQGRVCGFATAHLTARLGGRDVTEADLRAFAERPLAVPLSMRLLTGEMNQPD